LLSLLIGAVGASGVAFANIGVEGGASAAEQPVGFLGLDSAGRVSGQERGENGDASSPDVTSAPQQTSSAAPTTTTATSTTTTTETTTTTTETTSSTTTPPPAPPKTTTAAPAPAPAGDGEQVVAIVNAKRAEAGCAALKIDGRITTAAQKHSSDMAARDYFSHDTPEGVDFAERMKAAGYPSPGGENIAAGQRSPAQVMESWMNSPGHRRNILDCSFATIGVGLDTNGWYWTQDFGR
jgi:uncharacterized protein YkwD